MKLKLCLMALLCSFMNAFGQTQDLPVFSIGDKVPDITIYNVVNHPTGQTQLSSYRDRLLILDFMATWCSLCVSLLPKTDSLQKELGNQVQFLPVTYQSRSEVEKFLGKLKGRGISISLPIAVSDTVLRSIFAHHYIPHYVWIDRDGIIRAITGYEDVTKENILRFLGTKSLEVRVKSDKSVPFDRERLLIAENKQIPNKNLIYQSAFTGFIEGLPSSFTVFPVEASKSHRVVATNARIPTLFKIAYGSLQGKVFSDNSIRLEMRDTTCCDSRLTGTRYAEWLSEHGYGYELIVPPAMLGLQAQIMQQDLVRVFPQYKASVEKREVRAYALVRTSKADKIRTKGGTTTTEVNPFGTRIRNHKFFQFIYLLNAKYLAHLSVPVIDRTDYQENIDLDLNADMSDLNSIREALAVYDLDIIETRQEVEVLVIKDAVASEPASTKSRK